MRREPFPIPRELREIINLERGAEIESHEIGTGSVPETKIKMCTFNVQKSWNNLSLHLEQNRGTDIHIITECPWREIKRLASGKSPKGIGYENTVNHRDYICLGVASDARVCIYIRKDLRHLQPRLLPLRGETGDIKAMLLKISEDKEAMIVGVYNDPDNHEAQNIMEENSDILENATVIAGDFNLHHERWDRNTRNKLRKPANGATCKRFIQLVDEELGLNIMNTADQDDTWYGHDVTKMTSTVDLVLANPQVELTELEIKQTLSQNSDHASIFW